MRHIKFAIAAILLLGTCADLRAIPAGFNIQGRLTDASGINKTDTFTMKFSIYASTDLPTAAPVWWETKEGVAVANGNFQVVLQGEQLEAAVKDLTGAEVEITVGNDPPMVPRQPLLRSPFSPPEINITGAVMFFAGAACPPGWRLANGDVLPDSAIYKPLVDHLKNIYGEQGQLPNMTDGAFIRGTGGYAGALGAKQMDAFQGHRHSYEPSIAQGTWSDQRGILGVGTGGNVGDPSRDASGVEPRTALETRPRNYAMTPCIKY